MEDGGKNFLSKREKMLYYLCHVKAVYLGGKMLDMRVNPRKFLPNNCFANWKIGLVPEKSVLGALITKVKFTFLKSV
jgi:hypothetical protein